MRFGMAVGLLVLVPGLALAGGFHNEDVGVRRMGMLATVARGDDATAVFHNPATLMLTHGTSIYHSQSVFMVDLAFKMYDSQGVLRPDHELRPDWSVGWVPFLGGVTDLGTQDFRLAFAVYAPNAYGALMPDDEATRYHATKVLFLSSRATASLAYKISEALSVAVNLNLVHMLLSANRIMNLAVLSDPDARFLPQDQTAASDAELSIGGQAWTWSWDIGVLITPIETLRIGATFFAGAQATIEGNVDLTSASGIKESTTQSTPMVIPFTMKVGINWEFAPDFEIGADYRYYHYQIFQEQHTQLGAPLMGISEFRDPKNYSNAGNWCVGLMYHLNPSLDLMMGYQEDYTPIPEKTFTLENPSRDQLGFSLGARWRINPHHRIGMSVVRNWFDLVDVQTSLSTPPNNIKGHGSNFEVGLEYEWHL